MGTHSQKNIERRAPDSLYQTGRLCVTNTDRILQTLSATNGVLCDDCISRVANVHPRQQVNTIAGGLFFAGRIFRQDGLRCSECGRIKKGSASIGKMLLSPSPMPGLTLATQPIPLLQAARPSAGLHRLIRVGEMNPDRPWHWEGNVQIILGQFLVSEGWTITHFADTESKETGIDLGVTKNFRGILFEIKGYPTTVYEHGPNRGQLKSTPPNSQARQWYSHALLGMMRLREKHPDKEIALCFPDFPTYRRLVENTRSSLKILAVAVYLATATGDVSILMDPSPSKKSP